MLKKISALGLTMLLICWQVALSQTADFDIDQPTPICVNECITLTDNSTSPVNITTWTWTVTPMNGVTIDNPNDQNPGNICFAQSGNFLIQLAIEDANGNVANANKQIDVVVCSGSLSAGFRGPSTVCLDECVTFTDTSVGTPTTYNWVFIPASSVIPGTSTEPNPTICFIDESVDVTVELEVMNADGKISKTTKQIVVVPNPTVFASQDTIIELGSPAIVSAVATNGNKYRWEPSTSVVNPKVLTTFVYPEETTDYSITVSDGNGCTATDTVRIFLNFIPEIGVPTAFSPNGDGKNDLLVVKGMALSKCIFKVYNRYGIQIFESDEQKNGWDGNYRGKPEDPGVFYWTLDYEFNTGKSGTLSGNTTLVR